ncbi:hypothetical protein R3P38DRAFT_2813691 [Favolaschia claudopus]|uniref:Uncharacterized protein n=1 Tax=Favolaschia claudopus TaxID=2862362 RepID=A0AAV9Z585_9AGAR
MSDASKPRAALPASSQVVTATSVQIRSGSDSADVSSPPPPTSLPPHFYLSTLSDFLAFISHWLLMRVRRANKRLFTGAFFSCNDASVQSLAETKYGSFAVILRIWRVLSNSS